MQVSGIEPDLLCSEEREELACHEQAIDRGRMDFWAIGKALAAIRDRKLYREFGSFTEYSEGRWGYSKSRVYQLMAAAEVMDDLTAPLVGENASASTFVDVAVGLPRSSCRESTIVDDLPRNEGQARALAGVPTRPERRQLWARVLARAATEQRAITAEFVDLVATAWLYREEEGRHPNRRCARRLHVRQPPSVATAEQTVLNAAFSYGATQAAGDRAEQAAARKVLLQAAGRLYQAEQALEQEEGACGCREIEEAEAGEVGNEDRQGRQPCLGFPGGWCRL